MSNKNPTQCEKIMRYLEEHGSITQYEAIAELGIMRLASRISEMKKRGTAIETTKKAVKNRYNETCFVAEYSLNKEAVTQ